LNKKEGEVKVVMRVGKILVAVLATFCLTSALFIVKPSGSQPQRQYDPWMDVTDDGKIDMDDIGYVCMLFGTGGDSTKNVNVTNWPGCLNIKYCCKTGTIRGELPPRSWRGYGIATRGGAQGFKKLYLWIWTNQSASDYVWIRLSWEFYEDNWIYYLEAYNLYPPFQFYGPGGFPSTNSYVYSFDIIGNGIILDIGGSDAPVYYYIHWYMTA